MSYASKTGNQFLLGEITFASAPLIRYSRFANTEEHVYAQFFRTLMTACF
jgi:hypothetical protein